MEEIDITVFQCPVCGGVLDFGGEDETVCKSCGNQVHKFKTKTEVNFKVEYAMVSDGSKFTDDTSFVPEDLFAPKAAEPAFVERRVEGADIVRLDGLTKQLVWNYSRPHKLSSRERAECEKLAKQILALDGDNVYGRFVAEIALPAEVSAWSAEQILTRADALEIAEYILPVLREKEYQGLAVSEWFVNYIAHCKISDEEKYNNILAVLTSKYLVIRSLEEVKPILVDVLQLKVPNAKRYKLLMMLYASVASLTGENAYADAAGFMQYVMLSDLTEEQRAAILASFVRLSVGRFASFDQTVKLLELIRQFDLNEANKQQIIMNALACSVPRNLSFEAYFNLAGFIRDAVKRFQYLFFLFLGSYDAMFFKLEIARLFYHQHKLSADEMLLYLDMTRVFAEDNVKQEKTEALRAEVDRLKRELNLSGYDAALLKDEDVKGFFQFLKRYGEVKPALLLAQTAAGDGYDENVERALYSLSSLRLYYHKIYDYGIVAPYKTLDRLDEEVARLNEIKARFVGSGGKAFEIKASGAAVKPKRGAKDTLCNLLAMAVVFLIAASVALTFLPAYGAFTLAAVWTVLLAAVNESKAPKWVVAACGAFALGGLYLAVYYMLRYIFQVKKAA